MSTSASNAGVKTHGWISVWFFVSSLVVYWDASYCLLRPRSMVGGDLHWLFSPYALYATVDYGYGIPALEHNDGFPSAQAFLNLFENAINFIYLYKTHVSPSPLAPLIGFSGALMTLAKTVLYISVDYFCGWCNTGHNEPWDLLTLYIIPSGLWILVPGIIVYVLGRDLSSTLRFASKSKAE